MSSRCAEGKQTLRKVPYMCQSELQSTILIENDSASGGISQSVTSAVYQSQHAWTCCAAAKTKNIMY